MKLRIILPVVVQERADDYESVIKDLGLSEEPDSVPFMDQIFYSIDSVEQSREYGNTCYVYSGGYKFEVLMSAADVDKKIMDDIIPWTYQN